MEAVKEITCMNRLLEAEDMAFAHQLEEAVSFYQIFTFSCQFLDN